MKLRWGCRVIALGMILCLMLSSVMPAFADEIFETETEDEFVFEAEIETETESESYIEDEVGLMALLLSDDDHVAWGYCSDDQNVLWAFYPDGNLRIIGSGEMYDYSGSNRPEWENASLRNGIDITSVTIINKPLAECQTLYLGDYAFYKLSSLKEVDFESEGGYISVGRYAFAYCNGLEYCEVPSCVSEIGKDAFTSSTPFYLLVSENSAGHTYCLSENVGFVLQGGMSGDKGNYTWDYNNGTLFINGTGILDNDTPWKSWVNAIYSIVIEGTDIELPEACFADAKYLEKVTMSGVDKINDSAFRACHQLKDLSLGESLKYIGSGAFAWCTSLNSIDFPDSVEYIGTHAFYGAGLEGTLRLPAYLKAIEEGCFERSGTVGVITSVIIPDSVEIIGKSAFANQKITSLELGEAIVIIDDFAFSNNNIREIKFNEKLERIGQSAFCFNDIVSIALPDATTFIGEEAFDFNTNLHSVKMGPKVAFIGADAFAPLKSGLNDSAVVYCYADTYAYSYCVENDFAIVVLDGLSDGLYSECSEGVLRISGTGIINQSYVSDCLEKYGTFTDLVVEGSNIEIGTNSFFAIKDLNTVKLSGVTSIGVNAFAQSGIRNVEIGNGLISIEKYAFCQCLNLRSIVLPDSLEIISDYAFDNTWNLQEIVIPESVTRIGSFAFHESGIQTVSFAENSQLKEIGDYAFFYDFRLQSFVLPYGIERLGTKPFDINKQLAEIYLPETITYIKDVDDLCKGNIIVRIADTDYLRTIFKHKKAILMGNEAFGRGEYWDYDEENTTLTIYGNMVFELNMPYPWSGFMDDITTIIVEGDNIRIPDRYFANWNHLTGFTCMGLASIGKEAFAHSGIESIFIPDGTEISSRALQQCYSLREVRLPDDLTELKSSTLSSCSSLETVVLPKSLTTIGCYAFSHCDNLKTVVFGDKVSTIDYDAFKDCPNLEITKLPDSVTYIGIEAFYGCKAMKNFYLSGNIRFIGHHAFTECDNLEIYGYKLSYIEQYANDKGIKFISLPEPKKGACYYAEDGNVYQVLDDKATTCALIKYCGNADYVEVGGDVILDISAEADGVSSMSVDQAQLMASENTFIADLGLDTVADVTCTQIKENAFFRTALKSVIIKSSIESIQSAAFKECISLHTVSFIDGSSKLTVLADDVFNGCINLKIFDANGYNHIRELGNCTFLGCKNLQTINMPEVIKFGKDVFDQSLLSGQVSDSVKKVIDRYKKTLTNDIAKPEPVTDLKAVTGGDCQVNLTWKAPVSGPKPEGYLVYAQKNGQYGYAGMTTKGCSFTDKKALNSDYNFYWVFSYVKDANGKMFTSGCTKYVYAKGKGTLAVKKLPAVANVKAVGERSAVKLTWSAVSGADGYLIYGYHGSPNNGAKYGYIGMTYGNLNFTDKGARKDDYNFYFVFAFKKDVNGKMIAGDTGKYVFAKAK